MTLGNLGAAAFIALAGAVVLSIVILYLFRLPPKRAIVSSLKVWRVVAEELNERRRRQWRWWASLALMCLMGFLLLGALGDPSSGAGVKTVLLLDTGPTMAASAGNRTVWDVAVSRAQAYIRSRPRNRFWLADSRGRELSAEFVDAATASDRVAEVRPAASGDPRFPDLPEADETVFFSDGILPPPLPANTQWISLFSPRDNVAITEIGSLIQEGDERRLPVLLANFSDEPRQVEFRLISDSQAVHSGSVVIGAGTEWLQELPIAADLAGVCRIEIESEGETQESDNLAYTYIPTPQTRVSLVTSSESNLRVALASLPELDVLVYTPQAWDPADDRSEVVIFEDWTPAIPATRPALYVGEFAQGWLGASQTQAVGVSSPEWGTEDAMFDGLSFRDLVVDEGPLLVVPDARVLIGVQSAPLLIEWPGQHRMLINFSLSRSNWTMSPAFPVLLDRILTRLVDKPHVVEVTPGTISLPVEATSVLSGADAIPASRDDSGVTFEAPGPGVYEVLRPVGRPWLVLANSIDRRFSDFREARLTPSEAVPTPNPGVHLWQVLIVLACCLLAAEWFLFHRGTTV